MMLKTGYPAGDTLYTFVGKRHNGRLYHITIQAPDRSVAVRTLKRLYPGHIAGCERIHREKAEVFAQ